MLNVKLWMNIVGLAFLLLTLVISSERGEARGDHASDVLFQESEKGVAARARLFEPQWWLYTVKEFKKADLTPRPMPADTSLEISMEYARKGNKSRSWGRIIRGSDSSEWERTVWCIDNGETRVSQRGLPNHYNVSRTSKPFYAFVGSPLSVAGEAEVVGALIMPQVRDPKVVGKKASHVVGKDGEASIDLEWSYAETRWKNKCRLSPSRDWTVEWLEVYTDKGVLAYRHSTSEWATVDGIAYPKRCRQEGPFDANGKPRWTVDVEVTSLVLQGSKIPESLFHFDFPEDAVIWDADKKMPIRKTELTQTHLDEVVKRIENPRTHWWKIGLWTLLGIGLLLVAFLIYFVYRRRVP